MPAGWAARRISARHDPGGPEPRARAATRRVSARAATTRAGTRPLRVGIIGAGNIARNHVQGYRAAGAQIVAIADTNPATLETRSAEWSVRHAFRDFRDLLALPGLDAVSICTPNAAHHGPTLAAAAAGKHVLCEKPISLSLTEADEMIAACREAGVVLQVDHHLRSNRAVERARRMIDAGELGRDHVHPAAPGT